MLPRLLAAVLALLSTACAAPRVLGSGVELETLLYGGGRVLASSPYDGHPVVAAEIATNDTRNGWGYEVQASYGEEDVRAASGDLEGRFEEYSLGVRHTFGGPEQRIVVGFGGAVTRVQNSLDSPDTSFQDHGGGAYAHAALQWALGEVPFDPGTDFLAGLDLRALVGDDYDYVQLALVLGFAR